MLVVCTLAALVVTLVSVPVAWVWMGPWALLTAPVFASAAYLVATAVLSSRTTPSPGNPGVAGDHGAKSVLGS